MIYGYCRVSSKTQIGGNSFEEQEALILKEYPNAEIIKEQYTGAKMDRPLFSSLINKLQEGDKLVVSKLDRFCRTTKEGLELIDQLMDKGVKIHILNMGLVEDTALGRMIITNLLAFAEFERAMILERTQAGKEIAKTKDGFKEGRPKKYTDHQIKQAVYMIEHQKYTYKVVEQLTRISKATLIRAVKKYRDQVALGEIAEIGQLPGQTKI